MDYITHEANIVIISGIMLFFSFLYYKKINLLTISILLGYFTAAYKIDCMIIGNCLLYSKYIAYFTFLITLIAIIYMPNNKNYLYMLSSYIN